jgi:hypothetical protein
MRTKYQVDDSIHVMEHDLTPILMDIEECVPESESEKYKVLEAKKLIYESLWEHLGVTVYHEEQSYMWIDVKPSAKLAEFIVSEVAMAGFQVSHDYKYGPQYETNWNKIDIRYETGEYEEKNRLTDILENAITKMRNISAEIIQRPIIYKRQTNAATKIQTAYRGWKVRKDVAWNIHHPYGKYLMNRMIEQWSMEEM